MRTRTLIIVGIVVISITPFATLAILDRYSNYVEQLEYEAQRIANEPKLGDKYYIEPELKAKLEGVEIDLRRKVGILHQGLPSSSYAVNLDHQTKEIIVVVENKDLIPKIEEIITQYPDDISFVIINRKIADEEFLQDAEPIYIKNSDNPDELIIDNDAMIQVQKILDKCDYVQKLESGEIPAQNPDGSINVVHGDLPFYNNGTHYIDSNTCKWIDSFESVTYHCFEANPIEQNWYFGPHYFENSTHHIDVSKCEWDENED